MKIDQLMSDKVYAVTPTDRLDKAASLMWENDVGAVPVVDEQQHPVAMLTDRDICMHAWTTGRPLGELNVRGAMSEGVVSCRCDDTVREAEHLMRTHQVRRLPVTDSRGQICGMLSLCDLSQEARLEKGERNRDVTDQEVALTLAAVSLPRMVVYPRQGASARDRSATA